MNPAFFGLRRDRDGKTAGQRPGGIDGYSCLEVERSCMSPIDRSPRGTEAGTEAGTGTGTETERTGR
ncbi:hypothetical protein KM295_02910 [Natronomonas sp. F2-12]|uniref:Uncharacterized protein n=1 Tax=Natronomonas aquatica TaxID=2841590 RepID=A0A9R1CRM3_9EURY|nr:hypothetical protein [Natronomonas aquatica]MCQ4332451.1 hypothetical protein [Natronomonas aquatica]